ncbi:hypothetical protein D3C83_214540 [compost metagenome]
MVTASPATAAVKRSTAVSTGCRTPAPAIAPAAKSSESPGRNGVTTRPVSAKTIANSRLYTQAP